MATQEERKINFVAILTFIVVVLFAGASVVALAMRIIDFKEFAAGIGPLAGALVGYWIRGAA